MTLDPHHRPPPLPPVSDESLVATLRWQAECGGQNMTLTTATVLRLLDRIERSLDPDAVVRWHEKEVGWSCVARNEGQICCIDDLLGGRYVTKSGRVLTDSDIEALADEAEQGYDVSHLAGRPSRRPIPESVPRGSHRYISTVWGWGAVKVDTAPVGWRCPVCFTIEKHYKSASRTGRHFYPFSIACTECARAAWIECYDLRKQMRGSDE